MRLRVELRKDAGRVGPTTGPWIRRRQVSRILGPADPHLVAEIVDRRGELLGFGLLSPISDITVRVLSWGREPPAEGWLERRLSTALDARAAYAFETHGTTGYREVNSEGDGLPGLVIDRYGQDRVIQLTTAPMAARESAVLAWLRERDGARNHLVVPTRAADHEGVEAVTRRDGEVTLLDFTEYGLRFQVPPPPSQKTGAYLDQRRNRRIVAQLAARHGGRLLDLGCHAGGFAVHAAGLGVPAVGLDRSRTILDHARRNAELNHVGERVRWVEADMFGELDHPELRGPFGTVVIDPPKMAATRRDRDRALAALERLVRQGMERLDPGGHLVVCSCSHHIGREHLDATVVHAEGPRGEPWTRVMSLGPGPDHPVWPGHTEGEYLRVNVYQRRPG